MNSYRIDTFQLRNGFWKAVAYKCGTYIGEEVAESEGWAIERLAVILVSFVEDDDE